MKPSFSFIRLGNGHAKVTCVCGWGTLPGAESPFDPQEAFVAASVDHMDCPGPKADLMSANEYQQKALRTEVTPDFISAAFIAERRAKGSDGGLDAKQLGRLIHAELGVCTETGESQDMVKKALIYGKPFDKVNVLEEAGDKLWYISLGLHACGFTMQEAMERNIAKLLKRFPERFTEAQAINRDVDAERKVLEEANRRGVDAGERGGGYESEVLQPSIVEVRNATQRLLSLLDDPHPGLSTWLEARHTAALSLQRLLNRVL